MHIKLYRSDPVYIIFLNVAIKNLSPIFERKI